MVFGWLRVVFFGRLRVSDRDDDELANSRTVAKNVVGMVGLKPRLGSMIKPAPELVGILHRVDGLPKVSLCDEDNSKLFNM